MLSESSFFSVDRKTNSCDNIVYLPVHVNDFKDVIGLLSNYQQRKTNPVPWQRKYFITVMKLLRTPGFYTKPA